MQPERGTTNCNRCFNSLGVDAKYKIFKYLKRVEFGTVSDIVEEAGLTQPTVSYHLKNMEKNGLLKRKKVGKEVIYSVSNIRPHDHKECVLNFVNLK